MNDRRRDDDDDDESMVARMRGYGRNERMPSGAPVHTSMDYLERVAALAAKAAVEQQANAIEPMFKAAIIEAESHFLERLGIPNSEDGFREFRKNQEWAQNQRELRALMVRQGAVAVFLAILGVIGGALLMYFRSGGPGK